MKFSFKYDRSRNNNIKAIIAAAVAIGLWIWARYPFPIMLGFFGAWFLINCFQVELSDETPRWWTALLNSAVGRKLGFLRKMTVTTSNLISWIWTIILFIAGPWFSTWCMQRIILEKEFFVKTGKSAWVANMLCILVFYLALLVITARPRWAWCIAHVTCVCLAFADYFVYEFRENEISYADFATIDTGLGVAGSYHFTMSKRGACFILLSMLACMLVFKFKFKFRHPILARIAALLICVWLVPYIWGKIDSWLTQTWEKKGTYRNGFVVNFILGIRDSQVDPPSGYSLEEITKLEDQYSQYAQTSETVEQEKTSDKVKPTIITIMDESFADFSYIGTLNTNIEVTPFINSLTENTIKGHALSSVYGAKTPNSEWEYMTGNTMAFLPGGSVVYQQYIDNTPTSIVSELKNMGYTAVAMHPYYKNGWRRSTVYPKLGFDESYFLEDGYFDETNILREYITDQELFDKIIDRYEEQEDGEPLFVMGITMQNHGSYKNTYDNFTNSVWETGWYFADANQYLSLIHETDKAVENLINYFSQVDEPVEIVFFGDHFPSLSSGFVRSVNGKGISGLTLTELEGLFSVPFFIWTNYDSEEETDVLTSLNFLSTMALEKAGLDLPAYNQFLSDLMKVVPAINFRGYYSLSEGKYKHVDAATGEEAEWIKKYNYLEYNSMFDLDNRSSVFFPYIIDDDTGTDTG